MLNFSTKWIFTLLAKRRKILQKMKTRQNLFWISLCFFFFFHSVNFCNFFFINKITQNLNIVFIFVLSFRSRQSEYLCTSRAWTRRRRPWSHSATKVLATKFRNRVNWPLVRIVPWRALLCRLVALLNSNLNARQNWTSLI